MGKALDYAAALIAIGAGLYLIQTQAVGSNSLIEAFMHGVGAYFVGKGIYMGRNAYLQAQQESRLEQLVELTAQQHAKATL